MSSKNSNINADKFFPILWIHVVKQNEEKLIKHHPRTIFPPPQKIQSAMVLFFYIQMLLNKIYLKTYEECNGINQWGQTNRMPSRSPSAPFTGKGRLAQTDGASVVTKQEIAERQYFGMKSLGLWSQNAWIWIPTLSRNKLHNFEKSLSLCRTHFFFLLRNWHPIGVKKY